MLWGRGAGRAGLAGLEVVRRAADTPQTHLDLEMETRADLERQLEEATDRDHILRLQENLRESGALKRLLSVPPSACVCVCVWCVYECVCVTPCCLSRC
jgi:hypothetical protein